jgi:hypothetical protein
LERVIAGGIGKGNGFVGEARRRMLLDHFSHLFSLFIAAEAHFFLRILWINTLGHSLVLDSAVHPGEMPFKRSSGVSSAVEAPSSGRDAPERELDSL